MPGTKPAVDCGLMPDATIFGWGTGAMGPCTPKHTVYHIHKLTRKAEARGDMGSTGKVYDCEKLLQESGNYMGGVILQIFSIISKI